MCQGNFPSKRRTLIEKHTQGLFVFFFKNSCSVCLDDFDQELRDEIFRQNQHLILDSA